MTRAAVALIACIAATVPALARADDEVARREARALFREGVRLLEAHDFPGALALFRSAYTKLPSARILLNIAGTLAEMGQDVEAANTYQEYLDAPDADPERRAEVARVLVRIDAKVATVRLATDPADAEVQIDDSAWAPAVTRTRVRLTPGAHVIRARKDALGPIEEALDLAAGARREVLLVLRAPPPPPPAPEVLPPPPATIVAPAPVAAGPEREGIRLGASVGVIADVRGRGAIGTVGVHLGVAGRYEARAAALIGDHPGGYAGGVAYLAGRRVRPLVSVGVPVLFADGARVAVRGAAGVAWNASRHLSLVLELGVERWLNAHADIDATQVVPSLCAVGRL